MPNPTGTAVYLGKVPGQGDARAYRLDPPLVTTDWDDETVTVTEVVVSAAVVPFSGPETYIFPAKPAPDLPGGWDFANYSELEGSYRGDLDHAEALRRCGDGYQIAQADYIDGEVATETPALPAGTRDQ